MVPVDQIRALDIFSGRTFLVLNNHQNERNCLMSYKKVAVESNSNGNSEECTTEVLHPQANK